MPRQTRKRTSSKPHHYRSARGQTASQGRFASLRLHWWYGLIVLILIFGAYTIHLDSIVRHQFEEKSWALPAQVYASPLELYTGLAMRANDLERELQMLHYHQAANPTTPGSFMRVKDVYDIVTRPFVFWDSREPSRHIKVSYSDGVVSQVQNDNGGNVALVRLDPVRIGGIYPTRQKEDRILVQLKDLPPALTKVLITTEDRKFRSHYGIDLHAMARALWADLRAGAIVQGGSTLTQQLVRNFFLNNKRTIWRKFNEVIMALLLEAHYSKDQILEAYINEVYLGQDGPHAIHGFGLASKYYFNKPVSQLDLNEVCTLVAMIRGPSYYNPETHMQRLIARRNLILDTLVKQNVIDAQRAAKVKDLPIKIVAEHHTATSKHPAFMDLVGRQLRQYYQQKDLTTKGLKIFTTLNPLLQDDVEEAVRRRVKELDKQQHLNGNLQTAVIVASASSGEIQALVSDADPAYAGYNRALDAERQIGSLMKPVVYLSALEQKDKYNWLSPIDDSKITLMGRNGTIWSPKNYDRVSHGIVPLITALSHSYNQASVRLGMQIGFPAIIDTLHKLGINRDVPPYPSILLGATEFTPLEVLQMYQTMAAEGFRSPLRAIREVMGPDGQTLRHYPLQVQQVFKSNLMQVLDSGLVQVVNQGTAKSLRSRLPENDVVAGKTGTTEDTRDSWFAGFDAAHVMVVWMGTDKDQDTGLTGSSGALKLWGDVYTDLTPASLAFDNSDGVEVHWVDLKTRLLSNSQCPSAVQLAFLPGTAPTKSSSCASGVGGKIEDTVKWIKGLFH